MCLLAFHWQPDSDLPLQVWANRDEFLARPAAPTQPWLEAPQVLAGRDLVAGGTWMGISTSGRFAALTNYRDPTQAPGLRSRGELASAFLASNESALVAAQRIAGIASEYGGFNLLLGDGQQLYCVDDRGVWQAVSPGWHGLSNARLDTPWPKLQRLVSTAREWASSESFLQAASPARLGAAADAALALLADTMPSADVDLPNSGVGLAMERALSPICIRTPAYGTRNSTWLRIGTLRIDWHEQDYNTGQRLQFGINRQASAICV